MTDANGNTTTLVYDGLKRKRSMSDPDMGAWSYGYDANGNLTQQTDAKSQVLTFAYDALNRMTSKSVNAVQVAGYAYDEYGWGKSLGHRTLAQVYTNGAPSATWTRFNYDSRGRIDLTRTSINGAIYETWNTYDAGDRVTDITYPGGEVVHTNYDAAWQPSSMSSNMATSATGNALVASAIYNPLGQMTQRSSGSATTNWTYDPASFRLQNITLNGASQWLNLTYGYDNVGNVISINDPVGGNVSFTYDELDRLKTANGAVSESYAYDPIGNLTNKSSVGGYTYSAYVDGNIALRQIKHAVSQAGGNSYAYDAVGNMTRRAEGGKVYGQSWDADDRLTGAFEDNIGMHTAYDADGVRVRRETYQAGAATFADAFNTLDTGQWTFNTAQQSISAGALRSAGNSSDWNGTLYRAVYALSSGRSAIIDFQVDGTSTVAHFAIEASDSERFAVIAQNGALVAQVYIGGQWLYPATVLQNVKVNTWYRLVIRLDDKAGFKMEVRERDGGAGAGVFRYAMTPGKTWRFRHWIWSGVALLDNYAERTDSGSRVTYANDLYEVSEPLDTPQTIPTPQPTATATNVPPTTTPTAVNTPTPTNTPTPANTPTPTSTSVGPTNTPTSTPTPTATPFGGGGSNLLSNGGFETGDLTGWELWDSGQSVNNSNAHAGNYGARSTKGEVRQSFNTTVGQTYDVSAWIRIDSQQQAATWGGIRVLVTDLNWNALSSVVLTPATSPIGQWTRVQFSFVATTAQSHFHAGPFTDGLYTISMDDFVVSMTTGSTATPTPTATSVGPTSTPTSTPTPMPSATPTATPASGLPGPWQYTSIGTVGTQGSASYSGGTFTLSSASGDIWAQQDSFRFAYQSWSGDGTLIARIASLTPTDGWAQAGLMFRESLNANARFGGIFSTAQNGVQMLQRTSTGGSATDIWPNDGQGQPVWLKLVRQGSAIRGYKSSNGTTWTQIGSMTVAMNSALYVGLAVTSQLLDTPTTAVMDNATLRNSVGTLGGAKGLAKPAYPSPQQQATFCTGRGYKAGCTITSYYYFNGQRVAMRVQSDANTIGVVTWLHSDMLGSASVATDASGNKLAGSDTRYMPFGEVRSGFAGSGLPTDRRYTGQISIAGGLVDMNARALDPLLGRFISADTIVPNPADPQSLNRFAYGYNSPLKYTDPTGHTSICAGACDDPEGGNRWTPNKIFNYYRPVENDPDFAYKWRQAAGLALLTRAGDYNRAHEPQKAQGDIDAAESLFQQNGLQDGNHNAQAQAFVLAWSMGLQWSTDQLANRAGSSAAGSIRNVNPTNGTMNCVNCAVATDATLAGNPASALPSGAKPIRILEEFYGSKFQKVSSIDALTTQMQDAGPGARGIVFGQRDGIGHVFNVVNQGGAIRYLDGQVGSAAAFGGYNAFYLLRTN